MSIHPCINCLFSIISSILIFKKLWLQLWRNDPFLNNFSLNDVWIIQEIQNVGLVTQYDECGNIFSGLWMVCLSRHACYSKLICLCQTNTGCLWSTWSIHLVLGGVGLCVGQDVIWESDTMINNRDLFTTPMFSYLVRISKSVLYTPMFKYLHRIVSLQNVKYVPSGIFYQYVLISSTETNIRINKTHLSLYLYS